jgi:hypothetical protein
MLNIYLISQSERSSYDTFDSAVVIASSKNAARQIHPHGCDSIAEWLRNDTWASSPEQVTAILIGSSNPDAQWKEGDVICASFNAG